MKNCYILSRKVWWSNVKWNYTGSLESLYFIVLPGLIIHTRLPMPLNFQVKNWLEFIKKCSYLPFEKYNQHHKNDYFFLLNWSVIEIQSTLALATLLLQPIIGWLIYYLLIKDYQNNNLQKFRDKFSGDSHYC